MTDSTCKEDRQDAKRPVELVVKRFVARCQHKALCVEQGLVIPDACRDCAIFRTRKPEKDFRLVLDRLASEDDADNDLATALQICSDGSWSIERESDGKEIASGDDTESLYQWCMTPNDKRNRASAAPGDLRLTPQL